MEKDIGHILFVYALRLLSRRDYIESEISYKIIQRAKKLKVKDEEEVTAGVVERLKNIGYINDDKFFQNYFEYSLRARPVGKFGFMRNMAKRKVSFGAARNEWEKREINEEELALEFLEKCKRKLDALPATGRKKKIAYLLSSRGFSPEVIWGILEKCVSENKI